MSELDSPQTSPRDEITLRAQDAPMDAPIAAQVLLASRSPRRTNLLRDAGIAHQAAHPGFDDALLVPGNVAPGVWIASLAYLKAWATWRELSRSTRGTPMPRFILGADTACLVDGDLVGTPTSAAEARAMISRMVARDHDVITGVAIIDTRSGGREVFVDRATVTIGELSDAHIDEYVATGAWQGKAGAYNLSERVDAGWPMRWEGDPTTIMGLPMRELQRRFGALLAGLLGASEVG
jgi:septum formation protein